MNTESLPNAAALMTARHAGRHATALVGAHGMAVIGAFHRIARVVGILSMIIAGLIGLVGCNQAASGDDLIFNDHGKIVIEGPDRIKIVPDGAPPARVSAEPTLRIDGQLVALDGMQRRRLAAYYRAVQQIHTRGMDTGKASFHLVGDIFHDVSAAIYGNDGATSAKHHIKDDVSAFLDQKITPVCDAMADAVAAQHRLISVLPAFTPYAVFSPADSSHCRQRLRAARQ
ncbi:hypothetical protein [Salinisphaera sp. Q1T1-3]|uniref:hypothetical protein n=1 Tax=Salinisphaera sp. Q1T1-3 TaxID=2321229 RepID=UPI000E769170|nr:hypothetical protein [Salinisphaera sp. Q1T1-3]RJS94073.1 hypothetical protein D3260_05750 [Salinisphaera sp. Q1T1-3]